MSREWVAVPTVGMRRWLALELARSLGASGPGAGDGVAANIEFTFPGALRQAVLTAGTGDGVGDPWQVDCLGWAVRRGAALEATTTVSPGSPSCPPVRPGSGVPGASPTSSTATQCAGPSSSSTGGRATTSTGPVAPLLSTRGRQPHLWRLARATRSSQPSRTIARSSRRAAHRELALGLPARLAVFGMTTLPSGAPFVELIEAVGARRDVHLMPLDPSPAATCRVREATLGDKDRLHRFAPTTGRTGPCGIHCCGRGDVRTGSRRCCLPRRNRGGSPRPCRSMERGPH